ncbi:MAG TPA: CHASE3 domain-containing protein [Xanthobacteraceae bacterium]|jgi:signal transduction histidine kinase
MPISKLTFVHATVAAILVGMAALMAIVAVNYWLVDRTRNNSETLTRSRAIRSSLVYLRNLMVDAETGQRGFLLTDDAKYLAPYFDAERLIPETIANLRVALRDDAQETQEIDRLTVLLTAKLAELKRTIDEMRAGNRDQAMAEVKTDRGRRLMDEARTIFDTMLDHAEDHIRASVADQRAGITALQWVTIGGALVILIVVGGSAWTILAYTRQLVAVHREVQQLNLTLEARVQERTADLGRANEEIQRFAYIVTHDLRAPLVNIMGFTSELESCLVAIDEYVKRSDADSDDPVVAAARTASLEDLPEAIGFIRSSTRKMDGLINAILKLSREGRRVLKPEPIRLDALLETAAASVQHQVVEAGGEVVIEARVPQVISDRLALEQIFGNLLDNAVKYRAPDRPLQVHIRAKELRDRRVLIEVADNGRGIARQDHERVFDLFRRSGAQDQPGEGIGLAHVRTMVRNLGGAITLESEPGRGTTMRLDLPRELRRVVDEHKGAA